MKKALAHLTSADPVLARLIERVGACRIRYLQPVFGTLARSIVFQQLNGRAASTIFERLRSACGPDGPMTAATVLKLRPARMRSLGVSPQKTAYIRDLARKTRDGEVDFDGLRAAPDSEVIERLVQVKGIGVWTVQMFLIFALRRPDVLPTADYGIRVAMKQQYGLPELPKPPEMERLAAPWLPYRSVACWYLWRSLDNQPGL